MRRFVAWWKAQPRVTQLLVALGVPAVAIAAIVTGRRQAGAPAEGGEGGSSSVNPTIVIPGQLAGGVPTDSGGLDQLTGQFADLEDFVGSALVDVQDQINQQNAQAPPPMSSGGGAKDQGWYDGQGKGFLEALVVQGQAAGKPHIKAATALANSYGHVATLCDPHWWSNRKVGTSLNTSGQTFRSRMVALGRNPDPRGCAK